MSEVDKFELLLAPPCIALAVLPLWLVYKAYSQGVENVRHLINRYAIGFGMEMVVVVLLSFGFMEINSFVAAIFAMIAYSCLVFAAFPIYAILLTNIIYLLRFVVRKKYKIEGWDVKQMAVGRKRVCNG